MKNGPDGWWSSGIWTRGECRIQLHGHPFFDSSRLMKGRKAR
jgi:hypothetical protein